MRTVIYSMGVSLDCYSGGPDGHDWGAPDAELHRFHNQQASELGLHLLGRRLYEVMAFWETAEERNPPPRERFRARRSPARVRADLESAAEARLLEVARGSRGKTRASPVPILCRREALTEEDGGPIAGGGADLAARAQAHRRVPRVRLPRGSRRRQTLLRRPHSCRPRAPRDAHVQQPRRLPPLPPCVEAVALASFRDTRPGDGGRTAKRETPSAAFRGWP